MDLSVDRRKAAGGASREEFAKRGNGEDGHEWGSMVKGLKPTLTTGCLSQRWSAAPPQSSQRAEREM